MCVCVCAFDVLGACVYGVVSRFTAAQERVTRGLRGMLHGSMFPNT